MKITSFNPLIVTKDAENTIKLFEELGFEKRHTKENITENNATDVRMKDANGFHVDVVQGNGEYSMIRVNVDDFDEAIAFLKSRGFREPRHDVAKKITDTGSSKFTIVVSPSGYILVVSQHIKDKD